MNSAMISPRIMRGALPFLAQQRLAILGTISEDGSVWAFPVLGEPGFITSTDGTSAQVNLAKATISKRDMLWYNLREGAHLGMLVIDLATRRRLRINGLLSRVTSEELVIHVNESYANCPKYIQRRNLSWTTTPEPTVETLPQAGEEMNATVRSLFESADTLFI